MDDQIKKRFSLLIEACDLGLGEASRLGGMNDSYVSQLLSAGKNRGSIDGMTRIINVIAPEYLLWVLQGKGDAPRKRDFTTRLMPQGRIPAPTEARSTCQVVGLAGAGPNGAVVFLSDGELGYVTPPPGRDAATSVACEIKGWSLRGIADDGWYAYWNSEMDPGVSRSNLGQLCVVEVESLGTLLKYPYEGSEPGFFNLESPNFPTMRNMKVLRSTYISALVPRREARNVPIADMIDVPLLEDRR